MKYIGKFKTFSSDKISRSMVGIGFETLDRNLFNPNKCYDMLAKTGVKYARCQTGWAKCEKEKGVYDFSWLDSIVDNLLQRGIIPWFNVSYGNPLYMPDVPNPTAVGCVPTLYGNEACAAWLSYVKALAEHFKGRIGKYEIWNEADIKSFWYPGEPDGEMYGKLISLSGEAIKSIDCGAEIGAAVSTYKNIDYIENMLKVIEPSQLDFLSYHAYANLPEYNYIEEITLIRKILDKYGFCNTKMQQGEAGYPSLFPKGHWIDKRGGNSERAQAVWQLRRFFLDLSAGAQLSSFFQMADMWEGQYEMSTIVQQRPAAHGILNGITYTPKKSYETISLLANFLCGNIENTDKTFIGKFESKNAYEKMSKVYMTFEKDGYPVYVYYLPFEIGDKGVSRSDFDAYIYNGENRKPIDLPVVIDTYNGDVFEIDSISEGGVLTGYHGLPFADYPMIITDRAVIEKNL